MAQPARLKLAFYQDQDTAVYQYAIKPFVDSINVPSRPFEPDSWSRGDLVLRLGREIGGFVPLV